MNIGLNIGRTDAKAETPILWPSDVKNWLIWKDPDAGKDWRQEEKRTTEDEMVGWHHQLNGHEFEQAPGFGNGQGGLACCSPWGRKQSDMNEQLNWTETTWTIKNERIKGRNRQFHNHSRTLQHHSHSNWDERRTPIYIKLSSAKETKNKTLQNKTSGSESYSC